MSVYVIAEAGVNHNGDIQLAHRLVDAAADAGADAVKFQTFVPEQLVTHDAQRADYQKRNQPGENSQLQMLSELALSHNAHSELLAHCQDRNIDFLSSPFDAQSADFLIDELQLPLIKLGSGELTNGPLLWQLGKSDRRLILSTGMANLEEIRDALGLLSHAYQTDASQPQTTDFAGCLDASILQDRVSLLHCTTEYPCPLEAVNLRAMDTLAETFGLAVGYSDHTEGIAVSLAAAARGASVLEKHLTLDRSMPGPDHAASIEPTELVALVSGVRSIEQALGSAVKQPAEVERKNAAIARKSLRATSAIATGGAFTEQNIGAKRPGNGISPMHYWSLLGRTSTRDYAIDDLLDERSATDQGDPVA